MGEALKRRLKQPKFQSPYQEAVLSIMVAASHLEGMIDRSCAEFGITHQQYNILRILKGAHPEGHACGEIASRMIDPSPDVTRRLDALEKEGLIVRERSSEDRRVVVTRITGKGLTLLAGMEASMTMNDDELKQRLTVDDCREISRLCEKIFDDMPRSDGP